jgi:hypothetical protein
MPGDIDLPPRVRGEYPMLEVVFFCYFTFGSPYREPRFSIINIDGSISKSMVGSLPPLLLVSMLKDWIGVWS